MTNAELNAAVAEHVAGWSHCRVIDGFAEGVPPIKGYSLISCPLYCHDANAAIALLEKNHAWETNFINGSYVVEVWATRQDLQSKGRDPSFCVAACKSLLRAHGHEIK